MQMKKDYNLRRNTTIADHFITTPHTFVCNKLLEAFSQSSAPQKCLLIYSHMHKNAIPVNSYTFPFVLKALAGLNMIREGISVHSQIVKLGYVDDVYVGNCLLNLYVVTGNMYLCVKVFDEMSLRDVVSWTTVIKGFNESGSFDDSLIAFEKMRTEGVMLNRVTAVNALTACAGLGALDMGIWIQNYVKTNGWDLDVILGTALIEMYGKCGRIEDGLQVLDEMPDKNVCTYNAIIKGLALSKSGKRIFATI